MTLLVELEVGVMGRYKFIRRKADESIVEETDWSKNMILNRGLDYLGGKDEVTNPTWGLNGVQVGSGNLAPAAGQTSLQTFVAGTVTVQSSSNSVDAGASPPYTRIVTTFRFGTGVAAGTLAEVGIGIGTSGAGADRASLSTQPLFSRALIVDGGGVPTTITVLSDEVLDVVWEYTKYAPAADVVGNFTIMEDGTPVNYNYTVRAASSFTSGDRWSNNRSAPVSASQGSILGNVSTSGWTGPLQAVFSNVNSGTGSLSSSHNNVAYVDGTYYKDTTVNFGLSNGNLSGGIRLLYLNCDAVGWQMEVSPLIPKNNTKVLSITFRTSFANVP